MQRSILILLFFKKYISVCLYLLFLLVLSLRSFFISQLFCTRCHHLPSGFYKVPTFSGLFPLTTCLSRGNVIFWAMAAISLLTLNYFGSFYICLFSPKGYTFYLIFSKYRSKCFWGRKISGRAFHILIWHGTLQ